MMLCSVAYSGHCKCRYFLKRRLKSAHYKRLTLGSPCSCEIQCYLVLRKVLCFIFHKWLNPPNLVNMLLSAGSLSNPMLLWENTQVTSQIGRNWTVELLGLRYTGSNRQLPPSAPKEQPKRDGGRERDRDGEGDGAKRGMLFMGNS